MSTPARSPRTRFNSQNGQGGPQPFSVKRVLGPIGFVLCPIGFVLALLLRVLVSREAVWRRVSGVLVLAVALGAFVLAVALGAGRSFTLPWRELVEAARHSSLGSISYRSSGSAGPSLGHSLSTVVQDRWAAWLWAQVPLSVCVAVLAAGWRILRLRRYAPQWRQDAAPTHEEVSDKKRAKIAVRDARTVTNANSAGTALAELQMSFGVNAGGKAVRLTGRNFLAHLLLLGPTGAGKTATMTRLLHGWLVEWRALALGAVILDFKGSPVLVQVVRAMGAATGRTVHVVRIGATGGPKYNPLRHDSSEDVVNRVINMLASSDDGGFTEPYYRILGTRWLLGCMAALDNLVQQGKQWDSPTGRRAWRRDLPDLAELCSLPGLRSRFPSLTGPASRRVGALLAEFDPDPKKTSQVMHDIGGMVNAVKLLSETGTGDLLIDSEDGIDLEQIIRDGDVVIFSLAAAGNRLAAQTIGNLAIADLTATFARLEAEEWTETTGKRCMVMLDEFGALGGELLADLYERSRSAGGTLAVSAQDDVNLIEVSPEFAAKVQTNSLTHILHQQYGDAAESHSKAIGTETGWKETLQVTEDASIYGSEHLGSGVGSLREVKSFRVHPDELKKLQTGEVILFSRTPWIVERVKVTLAPELPAAADPAESFVLTGTTPVSLAKEELPAAQTGRYEAEETTPAPVVAKKRAASQTPARTPEEAGTAVEVSDLDGWDSWDEGPEGSTTGENENTVAS